MKKLIFFTIIMLLSVGEVFSYPDLTVKNATPFDIKFDAIFMACRDDLDQFVPSGETKRISRGACLLKQLKAKVYEELTGGVQVKGVSKRDVKTAAPYESSGTSFSQFAITGPTYDDKGGTEYTVTRIVT